ncbi:hypothetical protein GJ496_008815 [Pomphorhynchus laevis]|nr:hypothetical protein GJ496_008815 [Pomphorhynchus laevis]
MKREKQKSLSLEDCSREELIEECKRLRAHVYQLRSIIMKKDNVIIPKKLRYFDMSTYNQRHVFLRIAYLGWMHDGYVLQEDTSNTIENILFEALKRARLIDTREASNYHRCGRTDKGACKARIKQKHCQQQN